MKLFFGAQKVPRAYTVLDHLFWVRLGALKKYYVLLLFVDHDSTNFLKTVSLYCVMFVLICTFLSAIASSEAPLCPMTGWVCQWKPFWILVEDSFKMAYLEEWVFISDAPSEGPTP